MALLRNITFLSLSLLGLAPSSPFLSLAPSHVRNSHALKHSLFARSFAPLLFATSPNFARLSISQSHFQKFTSSAISIASEPASLYKKVEFTSTLTSADINETCVIEFCVFSDISSALGGGGIHIESQPRNLKLVIRFSGFSKCQSTENGGALSYSGVQLEMKGVCFDKCITFKRGQAFVVYDCTVECDRVSVTKCSMQRPTGEGGAILGSAAIMRLRTMNISANTVAEDGAAVYADGCATMWVYYAMVSRNSGSSLFKIAAGRNQVDKKFVIEHSSIMYNQLDGDGVMLALGTETLQMGETNFIQNQFNKFCCDGVLSLSSRVVVDVKVKNRCDCKIVNEDSIVKVVSFDANMAPMETWECWAMGKASPTASRSVPLLNAHDVSGSAGLYVFLEVCLVGSIVAGVVYIFMGDRWRVRDLNQLEDVEISNK